MKRDRSALHHPTLPTVSGLGYRNLHALSHGAVREEAEDQAGCNTGRDVSGSYSHRPGSVHDYYQSRHDQGNPRIHWTLYSPGNIEPNSGDSSGEGFRLALSEE